MELPIPPYKLLFHLVVLGLIVWGLVQFDKEQRGANGSPKNLIFRDTKPTLILAVIGLFLHALTALWLFAITLYIEHYGAFQDVLSPPVMKELGHLQTFQLWSAMGMAISRIFAIILFLVHFHRLHVNSCALFGERMRFHPPWGVGWFFIPIFNLIRPFQIAMEMWNLSNATLPSHQGTPSGKWVRSWWIAFLLVVAGEFLIRHAAQFRDPLLILWVVSISKAVVIAGTYTTIDFLRRITRLQMDVARHLKTPQVFVG